MSGRGAGIFLLGVATAGTAWADETASPLPPPAPELLAPRPRSAGQPSMHPAVVLRDASGAAVAISGQPASAARTCDGCHDVAWIVAHDRHAAVWARERGAVAGSTGGEPIAGNCFLCHVRSADNQARRLALAEGRGAEAETATLASAGVLEGTGAIRESPRWRWRKEAFAADGSVPAAVLGLGRPGDRACGFCHGLVYAEPAPLALSRDDNQGMTELGGVVFSGQRLRDSAENLAGKDGLARPWDVHAERMVSCANCHFSPNHPAYAFSAGGPEHLAFDARRLAITEYLRRPDHRLAAGPSRDQRQPATLRPCTGCHEPVKAHAFLPRAERHFSALQCEACHVPMAHAPARQESDFTMSTVARKARVVQRGVRDDGFVLGFRPALLRRAGDGRKLGPSNLVTTYRWVEQTAEGARPVGADGLERAFFAGGTHRPELVRALDRDGDGQLDEHELILDTEAKVKVARDLLVAAGARTPAIRAEVQTYAIHHGISPGRFATRDCSTCHGEGARIGEPFVLASTLPFGATISVEGGALPGQLVRAGGGLVLVPDTAGLHVFGHTRSRILDGLGLVLLAGTFAGVGAHGLLRFRSARRRRQEQT